MLINNFKDKRFIKWIVNNNCNYYCSYCFEKDFHKHEYQSEETIETTAKKINKFMFVNNLDSIILLGGELFLLDKKIILNILNILKNKKRDIYIISNFFASNNYYKEIETFCLDNFKNFEYKFSFHDEFVTIDDFVSKVLNYLETSKCKSIKLQFTLDINTEKIFPEFLKKISEIESKYKSVSHHIEKAYSFNSDRTEVKIADVKTKLSKKFIVNGNAILAEELFKNGPLNNYGAKCFQPFFHLENNILYSHCYGRKISNDFLNYEIKKESESFVCNRHSCLIYKTSIIQKIS